MKSGILPSSAIDLSTFKKIFGDLISDQLVPIILKYLQRMDQIVVTDLDDAERATIKFLNPSALKRESKKVAASISDRDRGLIALRKSLEKMEKEVSVLENKIEETDMEIRNLLKVGKKPLALRTLKKKKILEKGLVQKDKIVTNIENMLFQLENSENDEKVLFQLVGILIEELCVTMLCLGF